MQNVYPFPPRPNSVSPMDVPPISANKVLEIVHYYIALDEDGEALVLMAPPDRVAGLHASDLQTIVEAGHMFIQQNSEFLAGGIDRYFKFCMLINLRVVYAYVSFMKVLPTYGERIN